jgi:V-type H+-transporting ATPase subunit F
MGLSRIVGLLDELSLLLFFRFLAETTAANIEDAFRDFTSRDDVSVVLINQSIASVIRHALDSYNKPVPAVLEIPSKDQPYDPSQDSILSRVKFMFGEG